MKQWVTSREQWTRRVKQVVVNHRLVLKVEIIMPRLVALWDTSRKQWSRQMKQMVVNHRLVLKVGVLVVPALLPLDPLVSVVVVGPAMAALHPRVLVVVFRCSPDTATAADFTYQKSQEKSSTAVLWGVKVRSIEKSAFSCCSVPTVPVQLPVLVLRPHKPSSGSRTT
ncbi:uncharacterized protein LOC135104660 [Scylla paramamosain]|uniref:uncharacterized protein LOC135104660 n=1 Tax=Scylla paramamosain TaxID=85552 RepID=UPI0030830DDD